MTADDALRQLNHEQMSDIRSSFYCTTSKATQRVKKEDMGLDCLGVVNPQPPRKPFESTLQGKFLFKSTRA